jgi:phosphopentomutase
MSRRAFILVLDSFGIGSAQDASAADQGANTLLHIAHHRPLKIPHLCQLGLNEALKLSCDAYAEALPILEDLNGAYGYAVEQSAGKDTPSGHWEMAGLPVLNDWGYFNEGFSSALIEEFISAANLPGVLGLCHASGTEIIERLGEEHIRTGKPIVYTSADSVFQIAAHEQYFGLHRLYEICEIARELVDAYRIGRVIARPFVGEAATGFVRTGNRHDLVTPPFAETLLDKVKQSGRHVYAIGKISDIFANQGVTHPVKASNNDESFRALLACADQAVSGDLVFVNFNDFDTLYGHRRNVAGYASALEQFDKQLPDFLRQLRPGDLAVISADHGCDPTWPGSDHTREHVPVLAFGPGIPSLSLGRRESFADIGQTIAAHLGLQSLAHGQAFL